MFTFKKLNAYKAFRIVVIVTGFLLVYAMLYSNLNTPPRVLDETYSSHSPSPEPVSYDFAYNYSYPHFNSMEMLVNDFNTDPPSKRTPRTNVNSKILFVSNTFKSNVFKSVIELVTGLRFSYRIETVNADRVSPSRLILQFKDRGYYSLIMVESLQLIESIGERNRIALKEYCQKYQVGIVYLLLPNTTQHKTTLLDGKTRLLVSPAIFNSDECRLGSSSSSFYKLLKFNSERFSKKLHALTITATDSQCYEPIVECSQHATVVKTSDSCPAMTRQVVIGIDEPDTVQIYSLLLLESIRFASYERLQVDFERNFQIDIDDVFVGPINRRMKSQDVEALIDFQRKANQAYFGQSSYAFRFNLGFSGYYYKSGTPDENSADEQLVSRSKHFNWFEHGWFHFQPHQLNASQLREHLLFNFHFAMEHGIPVDSFYAVSPHHSGIYPVYAPLFKSWKDVWLIKATSTEGYPHLRPFYSRRGFIGDNIMVVPRQTCGIYTHTLFIDSYPNGIGQLDDLINGGELFKTVLLNRVLIFMTHMTNYGNDRLALYVFDKLFKFVAKWTNLYFVSLPPLKLAQRYFEIYPEDRDPLWTNACTDRRHLAIWSKNFTKYCDRLPKLIILGPQKTGSTALYSFLKLHPLLRANKETPEEHEETQFFTNNYYHRGPEWYMSLFRKPDNSSIILFEKSANYFSEPKAPPRIKSLINDAKLVIITIDPAKRAYSWYQHMKYHNNSAAVRYSFYDLVSAGNQTNVTAGGLDKLRSRCLDPGNYYKHLKAWLNNFPARQILMVDGDQLRKAPYATMAQVQQFLELDLRIDYRRMLKYDKKKGFYCMRTGLSEASNTTSVSTNCLGMSKGRKYESLDLKSELYLKDYFKASNIKFFKLLRKKHFPIPNWLKESLNMSTL